MPKGLLETYEQARVDPELLSLRNELAIIHARICELLSSLDRDAGLGAWSNARKALKSVKSARTSEVRARAIEQLEEALDTAGAERRTWKAVTAAVEQYRKLAATEHRRMVEMGELIRTEDALLFAQSVLMAVRDNVDDPDALRRIQESVKMTWEHR